MRTTIKAAVAAGVLATSGLASTPVQAQEAFIGQIIPVGFNFCPRGYSATDGQLLAISSNTALFSLLGTIYGGDGRTTFALPDLRGRVPMHEGNGAGLTSRNIGQRFGSETNTLTVNNLPSHTHTAHVNTARVNATRRNPIDSSFARAVSNAYDLNNAPDTSFRMAAGTVTLDNTGGGQAVNNIQPTLVIRYCIATTGIFPSRS